MGFLSAYQIYEPDMSLLFLCEVSSSSHPGHIILPPVFSSASESFTAGKTGSAEFFSQQLPRLPRQAERDICNQSSALNIASSRLKVSCPSGQVSVSQPFSLSHSDSPRYRQDGKQLVRADNCFSSGIPVKRPGKFTNSGFFVPAG